MNIELQVCGLVMLIIFLVLIERDRKLNVKNRLLFMAAFGVCIVCLVFDIASIVVIRMAVYEGFSPTVTRAVCKLYIMTLVTQGYCGFLYSCLDIAVQFKNDLIRRFALILYVIGELLIVTLPIEYYMDGRIVYSYGPATLCTYGLALFYIIATIFLSIKHRKKISHRRLVALFTWQGLWLVAAVIQFIFKEILLVGFAAALGMVVLYSQLENPNEHIDRVTGLFTQNALSLYMQDKFNYRKSFAFYTAKIKYLIPSVDLDIKKNAVSRSARAFLKLGKEPVFRLGDDMFCVIYESSEEAYLKLMEIKSQADGVTDIPVEAKFILCKDSMMFSGADEIFNFIHCYEDSSESLINCDKILIERMRHRSEIYNLIENALRDDRIEVYYQPIYDVKEGRFTTAEALVRIRNEAGKLIPPGSFIPVAEENGQIIPLGMRVFKKVCEFLATGELQKLGIKNIETNVSAVQFDHENPADFVKRHIETYNIDPANINLEITETADNGLKHLLLLNMEKLIGMGVSFSLDDFGTGRSNLDYFVSMPAKNIKFDTTFTQGYFTNDKLRLVMKGMVNMVHDMDLKIVSEGVETREQYDAMVGLGIDYIQGYYFSKPIPGPDLLEFLKMHQSS
ncbi:MAG: EAL domain-containing protein [Lachnospiraceae bacterium]|nr:EAL domain-containing protein [Lachnospiraceae bacterium]